MLAAHLPELSPVITVLLDFITAWTARQVRKGNGMLLLSLYNHGTWHSSGKLNGCGAFFFFWSTAWCDPNETKLLCLVTVCAIETAWESEPVTRSWGRTRAPNCFQNNTPRAGCKQSQQEDAAVPWREATSGAWESIGTGGESGGRLIDRPVPGDNFRERQGLGHTAGNQRLLGFGNIGTFRGLET